MSMVKGPPTCRWKLQASLSQMPATEPGVPMAGGHCPADFLPQLRVVWVHASPALLTGSVGISVGPYFGG